jgi:hypothetical protein
VRVLISLSGLDLVTHLATLNLGLLLLPRWYRRCDMEPEGAIHYCPEYIAQTLGKPLQTHTAKEALWPRTFLGEMRGTSPVTLMINCDNQGAISLAKDKFHAHTRHIEIRSDITSFVSQSKTARFTVKYIPANDNTVDIFTKPLGKAKFRPFELLGLRSI